MSTNRKFPKSLANALNYKIPSLVSSTSGSGEEVAPRTIATYTASTLYDGFEFAFLTATNNGGPSTYSIYGITLNVQNQSDQDIDLDLCSSGSTIGSFTLPANTTTVKFNDNQSIPIVTAADPAASYYIKCNQSTPPTVKAQGAELSYFLYRI